MGLTHPIYTSNWIGGKVPFGDVGFLATCCLALSLCSIGCAPPVAPPDDAVVGRPLDRPDDEPTTRNTLWYRIDVRDELLDVHVRLLQPPPTTRFFLPGPWAGHADYGDAIRIGRASAGDGARMMTIDRRAGHIDVESDEAEWIELNYRVDLGGPSRFHPQRSGGTVLAFGQTFLVTPARQIVDRTRSIPIEIVTPADHGIVSTWRLAAAKRSSVDSDSRVWGLVADDVRALRDAFVAAGPDLHIEVRDAGPVRVDVAFAESFGADRAAFADLVARVLSYYVDRFGAVTDSISVFVRSQSQGQEMSGTGRRGGFVLDVSSAQASTTQARLLVAHEALHLWNGHTLIASAATEESTRWFKEGVTHYIALKSLAKLGLVDETFVLSELARVAANYEKNPLSRGATGSTLDRTRFPYDFGVLVGLSIDAALAVERPSEGRVLEDAIVTLLEHRGTAPYEEDHLLDALRGLQSSQGGMTDVERIWRGYVRSRSAIDVAALFGGIGLHWLPASSGAEQRLMVRDRPSPPFRAILHLPPDEAAP